MDRSLVAALAVLAALAGGCGDATPQAGGPTDPGRSDGSPAEPGGLQPAQGEATEATSISLLRRGGVAGVDDQWRLAPGDDRSDKAFDLAARRSALEAEAARLDDEPVCCDFFVYRLTVRYEDGTFSVVVDDDPEAELIWELVDAVASTSPAEPAKPQS